MLSIIKELYASADVIIKKEKKNSDLTAFKNQRHELVANSNLKNI